MVASTPNPFEVEMLTTQYTPTLELLLQQKVSKLRGLVDTGAHVGKMASPIQQISAVEFKQPQGRYAPIQFQLAQYTRRWVSPTDRDVGIPVDTFDLLKSIVDPKAGINLAVVAAANRFFDDVIIASAFSTAQTGVDSSSLGTESWPASTFVVPDTFDSASTVGMTYAKVVEGRRILEHFQNDLMAETLTMAVGSQQNSDMLKQVEVIDKDYNDKPTVEDGNVTRILGTNIVCSERLNTITVSSNPVRQCIMFVKSGLYLGLWKDMEIDVTQRKDLTGHPWQLYSLLSAGATRTQLGKLVEVRSFDPTGFDPTAP
jgi:hypothetical protein